MHGDLLIFIGGISGHRKGTIISSLSIGNLIGFISRRYKGHIVSLYI